MDYVDERCCCGYLPITRGAQVIGAVYSVLVLISLFAIDPAFFNIAEKLWLVLQVVSLVLLFLGTTERHRSSLFMVPFLAILTASAVVSTLFYVISCALPDEKTQTFQWLGEKPVLYSDYDGMRKIYFHRELVTRIGGVAGFITFSIILGLYCCWMRVIYRCFKHIRMLELATYDVIH